MKSGLTWELPLSLVPDLVAYVVSRMNIRRTTALAENVCPRVLFTGIPVNYKKELQLAFGDYVEAYEGTDNTSHARSAACIVLYPANNAAGSWVLWKVETQSRVRRSNLEKLVTSDLIVQTMNTIARSEAHAEMAGTVPELPEVIACQQSTREEEEGPEEQGQEEESQEDQDRGLVQEQAAEGDDQETSTEREADSEEEEEQEPTTTRSG